MPIKYTINQVDIRNNSFHSIKKYYFFAPTLKKAAIHINTLNFGLQKGSYLHNQFYMFAPESFERVAEKPADKSYYAIYNIAE